ncbi:HD domain-containing protein [Dehalogenimonas alkenigignens]|uniref:HDIG domain n=1 Tax=Dehalogenimonas alkenigignens TaxID=1217799 RepID=A0A0W0GIZ0_9CHLR|nr:HD domain-containing protein [Dehalogenimonas alkenigignens]KTB48543.1 HDIG domain [Dehalogenimonas alkenigignens]PVV85012.1 HD domain-containing protein [Dehalogenimonas alkenigignens]
MNREQALSEVKTKISNMNLIKHMLATEAVMRAMAERFGEDVEEWGLAGLLHDIDLDECQGDMKVHGRMSAEIARGMGLSEAGCRAIRCHSLSSESCQSLLDKALYCADPVTGLITAGALIRTEKKLAVTETRSILKRFKEKSFAAGANREQIAKCADIGLSLEEFIGLSLKAMQGISDQLGL